MNSAFLNDDSDVVCYYEKYSDPLFQRTDEIKADKMLHECIEGVCVSEGIFTRLFALSRAKEYFLMPDIAKTSASENQAMRFLHAWSNEVVNTVKCELSKCQCMEHRSSTEQKDVWILDDLLKNCCITNVFKHLNAKEIKNIATAYAMHKMIAKCAHVKYYKPKYMPHTHFELLCWSNLSKGVILKRYTGQYFTEGYHTNLYRYIDNQNINEQHALFQRKHLPLDFEKDYICAYFSPPRILVEGCNIF